METQTIKSPKRYLRQRDLLTNYLPFSATTLWRKIKQGDFPAPIKLSPGITAWRLNEVNDWLALKGKL
jgi:predicted DNA-binding transcriptional regulator AlpA